MEDDAPDYGGDSDELQEELAIEQLGVEEELAIDELGDDESNAMCVDEQLDDSESDAAELPQRRKRGSGNGNAQDWYPCSAEQIDSAVDRKAHHFSHHTAYRF